MNIAANAHPCSTIVRKSGVFPIIVCLPASVIVQMLKSNAAIPRFWVIFFTLFRNPAFVWKIGPKNFIDRNAVPTSKTRCEPTSLNHSRKLL